MPSQIGLELCRQLGTGRCHASRAHRCTGPTCVAFRLSELASVVPLVHYARPWLFCVEGLSVLGNDLRWENDSCEMTQTSIYSETSLYRSPNTQQKSTGIA